MAPSSRSRCSASCSGLTCATRAEPFVMTAGVVSRSAPPVPRSWATATPTWTLILSQQTSGAPGAHEEDTMPKYVIERTLPGASKLSADELQAISQKSVEVLDSM